MPVIIRLFRYPQPEQKESERRFARHKEDRKATENTYSDETNALEKPNNASE